MERLICLGVIMLMYLTSHRVVGFYPMRCFQCNYYETNSNEDPNLQTALQQIEQIAGPTLRQCLHDYTTSNSIKRIDTSGIPSVECSSANLTTWSALLGTSLDGFKCGKIATSFTLTDMNSGMYGEQMQITGVARGCVPYKAMSPYGFDKCYDVTDTSNPYVQVYLASFNELALHKNIVLEAGVTGYFCMCSHDQDCNSVFRFTPNIILLAFVVILKIL